MARGGEYGHKYTNISLVYQHGFRSHMLACVYGCNQLSHSAVVATFVNADLYCRCKTNDGTAQVVMLF